MTPTARRLLAPVLGLIVGAMAFVSTAPAAFAEDENCGYPVAACEGPSISVSRTVLEHGESFDIAGSKFLADTQVTLRLEQVRAAQGFKSFSAAPRTFVLRTLKTDADGSFSTSVVTPARATVGKQDVVAVNATPAGFDDPSRPVTVVRGDNHGPDNNNDRTTPAFTGFNMLWLLLLAAVLIGVGVYAVRRGRGGDSAVRSIHG